MTQVCFFFNGCVFLAALLFTSEELAPVLSLPLLQNNKQKNPSHHPITSTFLWITRFEYCNENTKSKKAGNKCCCLLSTVQNVYNFYCWILYNKHQTSFILYVLFPFRYWCTFNIVSIFCVPLNLDAVLKVFSLAFYKLCVCNKCRNCSKIFCCVLTWSPFEVDKYQLFKQKIKQKQLKTYSEVNRWTVCKTKQFPKAFLVHGHYLTPDWK